jgi:hypothetical protein
MYKGLLGGWISILYITSLQRYVDNLCINNARCSIFQPRRYSASVLSSHNSSIKAYLDRVVCLFNKKRLVMLVIQR